MAQQGAAPQEAEARRSERAVRELLTSRLGQEEQAAFLPADVDRLLALDLVTPFRICAASKEELMRLGFSFGTAGALKAAFPSPGQAANVPQAAAAATACVPVDLPDTKVEDAYVRVDRLVDQGGKTIGTCVRVSGNIVLAARHCVVSEGRCLRGLQAFGGQLEFLAARADLDVVVFRGQQGSSFELSGVPLQIGMQVSLLSFPRTYDKELKLLRNSGPALDFGVISQVGQSARQAVATFSTGMPNSSGGAVVSSTRTLVGLYIGILWHLEDAPSSSSSSRNSGRSSDSGCGRGSGQPPVQLEQNPDEMWEDPNGEADAVEEAAASDHLAAQLSLVNIQHTTSAAAFIPALALLQFLEDAGLAPADGLNTDFSSMARRLRPRHR